MRFSAKARLTWATAGMLAFSACANADLKGRGLLTGQNSVVALSVLLVVGAIGIIALLALADRVVRSRQEAALLPAEAEETEDSDVIAGIRIGEASPPRWLYAAYLAIPVFAFLYVFSAADLAPPKPTATPESGGGSEFTEQIVAKNIQFNLKEIKLPANTAVDVEFDNQDAVPHNVAFYTSEDLAETIYKGAFINNSSEELSFTTPEPGSYYFHCDVHPGMKGTLVTVG